MGEVGEVPVTERSFSEGSQKRKIITVEGRNTKAFASISKKAERFLHRPYEFTVLHSGRETGIVTLPAFGGHTGGIPLDLEAFAEKYNSTIVTAQHPPWSFSPEFAVAQFEDLMEQQRFKDVVLLGPSLGGALALKILRDYQGRGEDDFSFKPKALATIGSPLCLADLKPGTRIKLKAAESLRSAFIPFFKLRRRPERVVGQDVTGADRSDAEFHGQIVRASALLRKPPKQGEYPDIPVLALTLPPGRDQIVKDKAKDRMREIFPRAEFNTFDATRHSQEEYVKNAGEIGEKIEEFLDSILLSTG